MQHNELGQPVGDLVPNWTPAERPTGQTLSGRTVYLEALATKHAAGLFAGLQSAPAGHWTYMPWGPFETSSQYTEWVEGAVQAADIEFLTICSPDGQPLGVAGYMNIVPSMGTIEVGGITYTPQLQGTLQATEAMYLMMQHAFEGLGYRRYEWKCDSENAPSRSAAQRLGFVAEGTFAHHRVVRGRNRDTSWFGITDTRWHEAVAPALRTWLAPENFDDQRAQRTRLQDLRGDGE